MEVGSSYSSYVICKAGSPAQRTTNNENNNAKNGEWIQPKQAESLKYKCFLSIVSEKETNDELEIE